MPLPTGFIELADPTIIDRTGAGLQLSRDPESPIFVRSLVFTQLGVSILSERPALVAYLGPVRLADEEFYSRGLQAWMFSLGLWPKGLPSAFVAPDGFGGRRWPFRELRAHFEHENEHPEQWRYVLELGRERWLSANA